MSGETAFNNFKTLALQSSATYMEIEALFADSLQWHIVMPEQPVKNKAETITSMQAWYTKEDYEWSWVPSDATWTLLSFTDNNFTATMSASYGNGQTEGMMHATIDSDDKVIELWTTFKRRMENVPS
jgi:hypothetical protein